MSRLAVFAAGMLAALLAPDCAAAAASGDDGGPLLLHNEVVLSVNTDRISRNDVEQRMGLRLMQMLQAKQTLIERGQFNPEAQKAYEASYLRLFQEKLREIVVERLLLQWSRAEGVRPDAREVDRFVDGTLQRNGGARRMLEQFGKTMAELRREAEDAFLVQNMRGRLRSLLDIPTRRDVVEYYQANPDEYTRKEGVKVCRIRIDKTVEDPKTGKPKYREGGFELAEEISERLRGGGDFAELARQYSDDKDSRERGGLLQSKTGDAFIEPPSLGAAAEAAVAKLKDGEVSEAVDAGQFWAILKLEARRKPGVAPLEEVYEKAYRRLLENKGEAAERRWLRERLGRSLILDNRGKAVPIAFFFPDEEAPKGPEGGAGNAEKPPKK